MRPPKLMDRLRETLRSRHYSPRTEATYRMWVERYIRGGRLLMRQTLGRGPESTLWCVDAGSHIR